MDDRLSERWRTVLTEGHAPLVRARRLFRHLRSAPRRKVCGNPFGGVGGRPLAIAGFKPSRKDPTICSVLSLAPPRKLVRRPDPGAR